MKRAFGKPTVPKLPRWTLVLAVLLVLVGFFELYSIIVPFQSNNPLWHQVTVGQSVIDDWTYGGQDEEGYLRFFNQTESVVLPPTAKIFSADGQFVVIEGYSPSSLTFAPPLEAIPLSWLVLLVAILAVAGWFYFRRRRKAKTYSKAFRGRTFRQSGMGLQRPRLHLRSQMRLRTKGFRAHSGRRRRLFRK